jgi:hypothetical protein
MTLPARPGLLQSGRVPGAPALPALRLALIDAPAIGQATTTNLFAQMAIGGGFTTVFTFLNTGSDTATGSLILTDDTGAPLLAALTSPGAAGTTASSFPLSVPSGGSQIVTAGPVSAGDPAKAGWARVESSGGTVGGVATFQLVSGGVLQLIVGVLSAPLVNAATIPLDDDHAASRDTGYAVANTGNTNLNIRLVLVNADGTVSQTLRPAKLNPLRPEEHVGRFVWEDAGPGFQFKGSIVLLDDTGQNFSVVALLLNGTLYSAIPAIAGAAPGIR